METLIYTECLVAVAGAKGCGHFCAGRDCTSWSVRRGECWRGWPRLCVVLLTIGGGGDGRNNCTCL